MVFFHPDRGDQLPDTLVSHCGGLSPSWVDPRYPPKSAMYQQPAISKQ